MKIDPTFKSYPTSLSLDIFFPRKWLLKISHAEPEKPIHPSALLGILVHKICDQFYDEIDTNQANLSPENHFLEIVKVLRNNMWDYRIPQDKTPIADELLSNFAMNNAYTYRQLKASNQLENFKPFSREEEIISPTMPIAARIDRINKSFNIIDYKSDAMFPTVLQKPRASLSPEDQLKFDYYSKSLLIQAVYAAILIEEKYGKLPAKALFLYLRHLNVDASSGVIQIAITREKIDLVKTWITKFFKDIETDNFPACTTINPKACYMFNSACEYKNKCDSIGLCIYSI